MPKPFKNEQQKRLYSSLLAALVRIGYSKYLIVEPYRISDWFAPSLTERVVPAAVFGRSPFTYDNACFAVLLANGKIGKDLVSDFRALGAPFAFEVETDRVTHWVVGANPTTMIPRGRFGPAELRNYFGEHAQELSPDAVLRAKNIADELRPRQIDFIDLGLLPALESHIRDKLDRLFREVLQSVHKTLPKRKGRGIDDQAIFRLVFRFLAAKVLHDRGVERFSSLPLDNIDSVLDKVNRHYGDDLHPVKSHRETNEAIAEILWKRLDFTNLSVEVLAYIYENTLVDDLAREKLGIHGTPSSIARYLVKHLPFEAFAQDDRRVLEPCSGHSIFLVAALQRLRDLLPADFDDQARHRYFVKMLQGYEIDSFALEIGRLCLVLADFPNPNGWKLLQEDVFKSQKMLRNLRRARIILCNPPFEDFTDEARQKYRDRTSVHKPVEVLHRVLSHSHPEAVLGFVLPRQFIDGRGYRDIRTELSHRYQDIEVVSLPDRIFSQSKLETSLLLARDPAKSVRQISLSFAQVHDADRGQFLSSSVVSRRACEKRVSSQLTLSMALPLLRELWEYLDENPVLGEMAEIHRGLEWKSPFREEIYTSPSPKAEFRCGLLKITDRFTAFLPPDTVYLSTRKKDLRGGAIKYHWDELKLVVNAARLSRGEWRIATFTDYMGLILSQRFHGIWPHDNSLVEVIEATLNCPVANAFVASREGTRDITKHTLSQVPFPRLDAGQIEVITQLVRQLRSHLAKANDCAGRLQRTDWEVTANDMLLAIDAAVLRAYDLPPRLERALLDEFYGQQRRVPFPFTRYYDRDFAPNLPLWMLISPEYAKCNAKFLRENLPKITDPDLVAALEDVE